MGSFNIGEVMTQLSVKDENIDCLTYTLNTLKFSKNREWEYIFVGAVEKWIHILNFTYNLQLQIWNHSANKLPQII